MKLLFLYLTVLLTTPIVSSFYDIKFETLDDSIVRTSDYQGKKCIITVVSANTVSVNLVRYLDSTQKANTNVQVIAIPTGEFDGNVSLQDLKNLKKNLSIVVTKPLNVRKDNSLLQHPLFVWLTQNAENQHFNKDVEGEGQIFIVSGKGTLYSVIPKDAPRAIITKIINQPFTE